MSAVEELIEALTEGGLTWGRPASTGAPEIRVKNEAGLEYVVRVNRFSFNVMQGEATVIYQCLTPADVLAMVRTGARP